MFPHVVNGLLTAVSISMMHGKQATGVALPYPIFPKETNESACSNASVECCAFIFWVMSFPLL